MKIALAIEHFSRYRGGAEAYAVGLAGTLAQRGWEVHLFGHSWDQEPTAAFFHPIPELPHWIPPSIRILHFAMRHRSMVAAEHFDVVLGFGNTVAMSLYQSHGGVHALSNERKLRAVNSGLLRTLKQAIMLVSPKYHARGWIESAAFRMNPRPVIIAISDMVRRDMAQYFRVDETDIRLVYNGIDQSALTASHDGSVRRDLRSELGFQDEVLFLFMAYDFRKKGVRYLLEAASELRRLVGPRRFGVVVVGSRPSRTLATSLNRLKLADTVVFRGPTRDPLSYYRACDVFVLPTFYDACSLVVFEAMAAGLPAITTVFNGAAGIITHGTDGMVLKDPRDTSEMASAMAAFLDRDALGAASIACRSTAARYTLEENHRQMIAIMEEAASRKS